MVCVFTSVFTQSTKLGTLRVSRWDICIAIEPHEVSSWLVETSRWICIFWTFPANSTNIVSQFGTFIFADVFCGDYCIVGTILARRNCKAITMRLFITYINIEWTIKCQYGFLRKSDHWKQSKNIKFTLWLFFSIYNFNLFIIYIFSRSCRSSRYGCCWRWAYFI